jgi:hypothetical protein
MPGSPAAARRVAGVGSGCSSPRGDTSRKVPRPGRGTALGCAGRTGARARDLALGARRIDPVARLEATAAGASRHGVNAFHLQRNARVDARLLTCAHARRRRAQGQNHPENSARRGGVPRGSAGQWPSMELAGRALAKAVRRARAASPCSHGAATW